MFSSIFFQTGDRGFDRNRLISPEPAFVLACETLCANTLGEFCISSKGRLPILHHQNAPVVKFASRYTSVGIAAGAFVFINNDLDGSFFKMHGHSSFILHDIKNPNLSQKLMFVPGSHASAEQPLIRDHCAGFTPSGLFSFYIHQ